MQPQTLARAIEHGEELELCQVVRRRKPLRATPEAVAAGDGWLQSWLGGQVEELAGEKVQAAQEAWRFYEYSPRAAFRPAATQPLRTWANGLELWERRVEGSLAPGGSAEVTLLWQAARPGQPQVLHFFNHLVHLPEDAPAGAYELRVGLYGLADGQRVRLSDGRDALAATTIRLPGDQHDNDALAPAAM